MEQLNERRIALLKTITKKIELKLTASQLQTLIFLITAFLAQTLMTTLGQRAMCYQLFQLYEKKLRPKQLMLKKDHKLKLDYAQAVVLFDMLCKVDVSKLPYETALIDFISGEIDRQTV